MVIYFITGNRNKFEEVNAILGNVEQLDIGLPEIQEMDSKEIIKAKLREALKHKKAGLIVEDTSLSMECLNGLPGPMIKWFMKTVGREGLYEIANKMGNDKAEAKCVIGYAKNPGEISFFEGSVKGRVVFPRGASKFGWDPVFQPEGFSKTFAEMSAGEKNSISHRKMALERLRNFLLKQNY
jgi:inosine triphosphate pyrophosphatase